MCGRLWASARERRPAVRAAGHPVAIAGGLRVGSSAVTTRGFTEVEMRQTGRLLLRALAAHGQPAVPEEIRREVLDLLDHYPLYEFL